MEGSTICRDDDAKMVDSPEESSWTFYIEGFMRDEDDDDNNNNTSSLSSEFESPSLVSDAASSAVKKLTSYYNCVCRTDECGGGLGFSSGKTNNINPRIMFNKQNGFKKQKTKVLLPMDFDLEDTASSPVNSPKVSYMNQFMNQKEKAKMDVSDQVKRNSFGKGGIFAVERDNNYTTDLKKRT